MKKKHNKQVTKKPAKSSSRLAMPVHAYIGSLLILVAVVCSLILPYNVAPEFSGKSLLTITFDEPTNREAVTGALATMSFDVAVEQVDDDITYQLVAQALSDDEYAAVRQAVTDGVGSFVVETYESFSPSISRELVRKAIIAVLVAMIGIIAYVSFVFRDTSPIMGSWKYGTVAVIALIHDLSLPFGVFALIASFTTAAIDTLFITAILATLGYSVNDTIVIFDRIRDRLRTNRDGKVRETFEQSVRYGVRTSIRRSIYTSVSTALPLFLLFVVVPTMKWFSLALFVGVVAGTYSSLFFGPSLLILWHRYFPQSPRRGGRKSDTERAEEALRKMLHDSNTI